MNCSTVRLSYSAQCPVFANQTFLCGHCAVRGGLSEAFCVNPPVVDGSASPTPRRMIVGLLRGVGICPQSRGGVCYLLQKLGVQAGSPELFLADGLCGDSKLWWTEVVECLCPFWKEVCACWSGGLDCGGHWGPRSHDGRCAVALCRVWRGLPGRGPEVGWWVRKPRLKRLLVTGSCDWWRGGGSSQHLLAVGFPVPGGSILESLGVLLHPS